MGTVTGCALETLVSEMSSFPSRFGASRVVAAGTYGLRLPFEQTCPVPGMGVVAGGAVTSTGGHVRNRCFASLDHGTLVALATELASLSHRGERIHRTGSRMAAATIATLKGGVYRLPEESCLFRSVWLVALMACCLLHRIPLVSGTERFVGLMTRLTDAGPTCVQKSGDVAGMRVVAGRTSSLGERRVLDPALPPACNLLVAHPTEIPVRFYEEALMGAAVGVVAVAAFAFGYRPVNDLAIRPILDICVALCAQRPGALPQQAAVAGHVWVMAGCALAVCDGCVAHLSSQESLQVVAP